ncbi:MAG: hypothetical protein RLZZ370_1234 [Bacteroidota bacterium]|jgi:hypothetical protein
MLASHNDHGISVHRTDPRNGCIRALKLTESFDVQQDTNLVR